MKQWDLLPGVGAPPLFLGMTEKEVSGVLGAWDRRELDDPIRGQILGTSLHYNEEWLRLDLDHELDRRVSTIFFDNALHLTVLGVELAGLQEEDAISRLKPEGLIFNEVFVIDSSDEVRMVISDASGFTLRTNRGLVCGCDVSVLYDEQDEPIWPDRTA